MSINVVGTVQRSGMAGGAWALVTPQGQTYEIFQGAPAAMLHNGLKVSVKGKIRDDVMTLAMIGPVLEVQSFEPQP